MQFKPQFVIEQLAICPKDPERAKALLSEIGARQWHNDHVVAVGRVHAIEAENAANLSYNYELARTDDKPLEFEVLNYVSGANWLHGQNRVSHLGMHCNAEDLEGWREFFAARGVQVAQEVHTQSHTNPAIKDSRRYEYVIFDTHHILGVDLKFIVRKNFVG